MVRNDIPEAEALLREHLKRAPTDVAAIRMLAEVAARCGRNDDAEKLLERCLELAPGFAAARHNYAMVLHRQNKPERRSRRSSGCSRRIRATRATATSRPSILSRIGEYERSRSASTTSCSTSIPRQAQGLDELRPCAEDRGPPGRQHRRLPQQHRRSIRRSARPTGAWPTSRPSASMPRDLAAMRAQLARAELDAEDRLHFDFALGKALRGRRRVRAFVRALRAGQRAAPRRASATTRTTTDARRAALKQHVHARVLRASARAAAATRADPIFIVGLPRSGSTLIEQILSSHRRSKARWSCPRSSRWPRDLRARRRIGRHRRVPRGAGDARAPTSCARWASDTSSARASSARRTAPFFIDKMPNNFVHVGLIHLMLPNAKIIDARRHPLGCCFSAFKQHFARGQNFSYDLDDIGRYYRDYVELMAHFDAVLPGRVHRVHLRAHGRGHRSARCGGCSTTAACRSRRACLRFFENERAGAHRQLRAGAPADLPGRRRPMAALRALAGSAQGRAGSGARGLSGSAGVSKSWRCAVQGVPRCCAATRQPLTGVLRISAAQMPLKNDWRIAMTGSRCQDARSQVPIQQALASRRHSAAGCVASPDADRGATACAARWRTAARGGHRHRAEARGEPAGRADQHPGARHRAARAAARQRLQRLREVAAERDHGAGCGGGYGAGPGFAAVYMRGVASGGDGNHSGSLPSVGMYLDEQPITTIQGALDIHMYDIARVEALAGPQGTLYGASSQAGTIRIITNKPDPTRVRRRLRRSRATWSTATSATSPKASSTCRSATAPRSAWWAGPRGRRLHRQRAGTRTFRVRREIDPTDDDITVNNAAVRRGQLQHGRHVRRARGAARRPERQLGDHADLDVSETGERRVLGRRPQRLRGVRRQRVAHFTEEFTDDEWWQAGLTIEGNISNFDLTYSGNYLDRDVEASFDYSDYSYFYDSIYYTTGYFSRPVLRQRRQSRSRRSTVTPTTTGTRSRATSCASARRRTTACAVCSASSGRSRSTTSCSPSSWKGSRTSCCRTRAPTPQLRGHRLPEQHGPQGHGRGRVRQRELRHHGASSS